MMQIILSPVLFDGDVIRSGDTLFVGTAPLPLEEQIRREAKAIVHAGLKDVLEWMGEPVYTIPQPHGTLLQQLRSL